MTDIAVWLRDLGLERYELAFREDEIEWEALPKLTAEDLKDLGVLLGSHRRKLLAAIAALQGDAPPSMERASAAPPAERRQLTVMFCDLVGSTELASRLDPEDLREVVAAYQGAVAQTVAGFDGFVAKYMGDGVLVFSATRKLTRTMPSMRSGRGLTASMPSVASMSGPSSSKRASVSPPDWWSSAT